MHLQHRVLVTGGSRFLGSHLCERLLRGGANVICVDNYFTDSLINIEHLLAEKHFEAVRHDVTFPRMLGRRWPRVHFLTPLPRRANNYFDRSLTGSNTAMNR
jgi:nucleoside-diphosphate-sugar epimerase